MLTYMLHGFAVVIDNSCRAWPDLVAVGCQSCSTSLRVIDYCQCQCHCPCQLWGPFNNLYLLSAAGSNAETRKAAADQIANISEAHPMQVPSLLRMVRLTCALRPCVMHNAHQLIFWACYRSMASCSTRTGRPGQLLDTAWG